MTTRAQKARLGLFLIVSGLILFTTVAALIGLTLLNPRDIYRVKFSGSVGGLAAGASVKMKGVSVGQVERLRISDDAQHVIVSLALTPGTPIKRGTQATINAIGITGLKEIELTGGTLGASLIPPNREDSIIKPGDSVIQTLTGKAIDIGTKTEQVLNNLLALTEESYRVRVRSLLENADSLATTWAAVGDENRARIKRIMHNLEKGTAAIEDTAQSVQKLSAASSDAVPEALADVGRASRAVARSLEHFNPQPTVEQISRAAKVLRDRLEDPSVVALLRSVNDAAQHLASVAEQIDSMLQRRDRQIGSILNKVDETASHLRDFSRSIKERPSLLLRGETRHERSIP